MERQRELRTALTDLAECATGIARPGSDLARLVRKARAALAAPAPDTLDAAWKDAEAALPSRYQIERLETEDGHDWHADAIGPDDGWFRGYGPTPIEALRNLTERLRGLDTEAGERGAGG